MKIIIFNDKDNFDASLNLVNKKFKEGQKRFWGYKKYLPFILEKVKNLDNKFQKNELKLVKTIFYTGKYTSKILSSFKWNCYKKINEINQLLKSEKELLSEIRKFNIDKSLEDKIKSHVKNVIEKLEQQKQFYRDRIQKQIRNRDGQRKLFEILDKDPTISLKTTKLKQSDGDIYQKGVDVKLATDLVHLAHTDAYDIAIILGGDSDLKESIKLVKENLSKTIIVISYYTEGDPLLSNISDLKNTADYFLNLNEDFSKKELIKMSDLLKIKD